MVYYSITEVGGKYFAFDRFVYDKGDGLPGVIGAVVDFFPQRYQIIFVIKLKGKSIGGASLVTATALVSLKYLCK